MGYVFKEPAGVGCEYGVCSSITGSCWTFLRTWQSLPSSLLKSRMGCCSRVNTAVRLVQEICSCPANLNIAHLTTHATKMCASICKLTWHVQFCFCHSAGIHILESLYIIQSPSHQGKTHQVIWGDYQSKLQKSSPPKKITQILISNFRTRIPNQQPKATIKPCSWWVTSSSPLWWPMDTNLLTSIRSSKVLPARAPASAVPPRCCVSWKYYELLGGTNDWRFRRVVGGQMCDR